ncbi:MAG: DapH/DapD/GlmU-related protein [Clostridia bacterium]
MSSVNAIILKKEQLDFEILFKKVSSYIEISLKSSNINNIFYADDFNSLTPEMLNSEYLLFIDAIVPEIVEYENLVDFHIANEHDISYFACETHSHTHGIIHDENEKPCAFGCSDDLSKLDIFVISSKLLSEKPEILNNPFDAKVAFLPVSDSTIVFDAVDVLTLTEDFKDAINHSHLNNGVFIVDTNNTYISSNIEIGAGTQILPNTIIRGNTKIGKNCILGPNTVIENMIIGDKVKINASQAFDSSIGDNTTVGPFAYIRPQSDIAANVKIGDFVEIKKASIGEGTKVSHLTYIGDATIGKRVNFGCGTVVVNYDGYNKYQTIVEDDVFLGCNTNLVSPVKVEAGAFTAAGSTITSDVPSEALAIARAKQKNIPNWVAKFRSLKSKK